MNSTQKLFPPVFTLAHLMGRASEWAAAGTAALRWRRALRLMILAVLLGVGSATISAEDAVAINTRLDAGVAVRDITPDQPIWLAGYAGRNKASTTADGGLVVQALALRDAAGERLVLVALDNCEVSHAFARPVAEQI